MTGALLMPTQKFTTPTLSTIRCRKKVGLMFSAHQLTKRPPAIPASIAANVSSGMVMSRPMNLGSTSASNGSAPMMRMASIS